MPNVAAAENAALRFSRGLSFVTSLRGRPSESCGVRSIVRSRSITRIGSAHPYLKSTTPGFSLSTM